MTCYAAYCTTYVRAAWIGAAVLCGTSGCWEEIEYTGPGPAVETVATAPEPLPPNPENQPSETLQQVPEPNRSTAAEPPAEEVSFGDELANSLSTESPTTHTAEPVQPAAATSSEPTLPPQVDRYAPPDSEPVGVGTAEAVLAELAAEPPIEGPNASLEADSSSAANNASENRPTVAPEPRATTEVVDEVKHDASASTAVPAQETNTRLAAWQLGSRLSLAALARDRGAAAEKVDKWVAEARAAAQSLGTSFAKLLEPSVADEPRTTSRAVLNYLQLQRQRIERDLGERHGPDHAALFEVAMKSNLLLVLYEPGGTAAESISAALDREAPQAKLPVRMWEPLLDMLLARATAADVRQAVQQLHDDVERFLANPVER